MLGFTIGTFVGGIIGMLFMALLAAGKASEERTIYKCKVNPIEACKDECCHFCAGASYCKYACKGHPSTCGMSVEKTWEKEQQWD